MMSKSHLLTDTSYKRVNLINMEGNIFHCVSCTHVRMHVLIHGLNLSYNGQIKGLQIIDIIIIIIILLPEQGIEET